MTYENEPNHSLNSTSLRARALFLATGIVVATFLASTAEAKDNPAEFTRVYQHTYDEVFQAVQKAVERMGCFVTAADKEKGLITGGGKCATVPGSVLTWKVDFQVQIGAISAKPETSVLVNATTKGQFGAYASTGAARKGFKEQLLMETQKVLATY